MRRLLPLGILVPAVAAVALSEATADKLPTVDVRPVLDATLAVAGSGDKACHTGVRTGRSGVVTKTVTVSGAGPVEARLDAARGDWDLAIFDATGTAIAGAAGPGATEVASGYARRAGVLTVQACRRSGTAESARVRVAHGAFPAKLLRQAAGQKLQLVSVHTPTRAAKERLTRLGLDLTEHGGTHSMGVVLHGARDVERLKDAGFKWTVRVDDLGRRDLAWLRADERAAAAGARSSVPSGRTTYRTLADYENDLKTLARDNPGLVKLLELPHKTAEGRTVLGVEIAEDVERRDGRPAFFNMGVHHAREWPSGEHAMEWAVELVKGYKAGDQRATEIVKGSRNLVVPIVNPDGFNASRGAALAPAGGRDEDAQQDLVYLATSPNEYRRKNCRFVTDTEGGTCLQQGNGLADAGVDPNRNYGANWGGPGAEGLNPTNQTYRGPAPFSEPETKNVQHLVSTRQVMSLITNHTTAGLVLRAPGIQALGDPVDEHRGYKDLGDDMGLETGYFSQKGFELYDTTGTTEDWSYNVTGGFGFTFEIYCGKPNYRTGDCDDPAFHPRYATMAKEWDGTSPQADHVHDPGHDADDSPFGMIPGYDGGGTREAYYLAAESAMDTTRHSRIEGSAPAGATLRLVKEFKTLTSPQPKSDGTLEPLAFDDRLETVIDVGQDGRFVWHVNPSTRPIVAKPTGREARGEPSPPQDLRPSKPVLANCTPILVPQSPCFEDIRFEVPEGDGIDNAAARIRLEWQTPASDYDVEVFRLDEDTNRAAGEPVASSQLRRVAFEEVTVREPKGGYVLRVTNRSLTMTPGEPYTGRITYSGPEAPRPGAVEAWTLQCERDGEVRKSVPVVVDRGQVARPDLSGC
jgi:hypothetical protein